MSDFFKSSYHGLRNKNNHVQNTLLGQEKITPEWSLKFIHGEQTKQAMIQNNFPSYLNLNLQFMFHT